MPAFEGVLHYNMTWENNGTVPLRTISVGGADVLAPLLAWCNENAAQRLAMPRGVFPHFELACTTPDDPDGYEWGGSDWAGDFGLLNRPAGAFGFANLDYYITHWMAVNNRSRVRITLDATRVHAEPLPALAPVLAFTHVNSCRLDDAFVHATCKPGSHDTCCFLTMGSTGWSCEKFSDGMARTLLDRALRGTMNARRIGACRRGGRADDGVNTLESTTVKYGIPQPLETPHE